MSSQQIKSFVSLHQFNQITQFELVSDEQNVKAYQFTEDLQELAIRILVNAAAGIGTQAIVAERGMGKSHLLNLVRSLANRPRFVNLLQEQNTVSAFEKLALPKLPSDGFPTLILGFDLEKGLNLVKAYPIIPGTENLSPENLITQVDDIIDQKIRTGVQIALFIDGISQFLVDPQQGGPLLEWLQELAKEAVNGKFSLVITLDQNVAEGTLKKILSTIFKYEYINISSIVNIIDKKIFVKTQSQRLQVESLYSDLRRRIPYFSSSQSQFAQLYPLHPLVVKLAPAVRRYARSFSLFGFITAVSSRALLRRAFNLICLDEVFDSFEFDLRKHPSLTETFVLYDYLFNKYIPSLPQPQPLYAKMMLKALLIFSLAGQSVAAKSLADSVMLYDERDPLSFIEMLNSIMARLAATSSGIVVSAEGPELSYKFNIAEAQPLSLLSNKPDIDIRTITKTIARDKPKRQTPSQNFKPIEVKGETSPQPPIKTDSLVAASSNASDILLDLAEAIPDDEIKLDYLLISTGKKFFKDWPFTLEQDKLRDRIELNIKWRGSLRKGILAFGGSIELFNDTDEYQAVCEYDWQIIMLRAYAPMALPPPSELPNTLLYWQPIAVSSIERLLLKQLLVINEARSPLSKEETAQLKAHLEEEVGNIFQHVYLTKGRLINNQQTDLHLTANNSFFNTNLTKLLEPLLSKRFSKHPEFEDLLTLETVYELLPWLFQPTSTPSPDQQVSLEQFARPLDLIFNEGNTYKISDLVTNVVKGSVVDHFHQALEQNQTITKLQAFKLVHKEPFGLQRPALLLILAILAASGQIVLLDEIDLPIHDSNGLRTDIDLSDFSSIRLLKGSIKQVSWKDVNTKPVDKITEYQNSNILVVDDDPTIHMILKIAAQKLKCHIETAIDGVNALEKLEKLPIHLLISDLRMPNMTGIELFQSLQDNPKLADIPFVVLSSIDDDEEVAAALEQGVEDYWIKPLRVNEIQARIKRLLTRQNKKTTKAKDSKPPALNIPAPPNKDVVARVDLPSPPTLPTSITPAIPAPPIVASPTTQQTSKTLDEQAAQRLITLFQEEANKEITILPGKMDLIKEMLPKVSVAKTPTNPAALPKAQTEKATVNNTDNKFTTKRYTVKPLPPNIDLFQNESSQPTITENKSTTDGLTIPTIDKETPPINQLPEFEITSDEEKDTSRKINESVPTTFSINLSNPEAMGIEIMQLYNQFWDTCRKVGNPPIIPEYEEFKDLVITKANKLKKQFHCDEIAFIVITEEDQAYIDCQVNRTSNFLKTPPKFRLL
ncbi:MAG: response regulator [Blastocatellia bacterium]